MRMLCNVRQPRVQTHVHNTGDEWQSDTETERKNDTDFLQRRLVKC